MSQSGENVNLTMTVTKGYADTIVWSQPIDKTKSGQTWYTTWWDSETWAVTSDTTFRTTISYGALSTYCEAHVIIEPPQPPSCTLTLNGSPSLTISEGSIVTVTLQTNNLVQDDILYESINGILVGPELNFAYDEVAEENKNFDAIVSTINGNLTCSASLNVTPPPPPPSGIQCNITTSPANPINRNDTVQVTMTGSGPITKAFLNAEASDPASFPMIQNITFESDGVVTGMVFDSSNSSYSCKAKIKTTDNVGCTITANPSTIDSTSGGVNVNLQMNVTGNATSVDINGTSMALGGPTYSLNVPNVVGSRSFVGTVIGANNKSVQCGTSVVDSNVMTPKSCSVSTDWYPNSAPRYQAITASITPNDVNGVVGSTIDGQDSGTSLNYYFSGGFPNSKTIFATVTWNSGQTATCNYYQAIDFDPCSVHQSQSGGMCTFDEFGYTCEGNLGGGIPQECRGNPNNGCSSCPDYPPGAFCKPPWVLITCPLGAIGMEFCTWQGCATDQGLGSDVDDCVQKATDAGYGSFLIQNCPPAASGSGSPSTSP